MPGFISAVIASISTSVERRLLFQTRSFISSDGTRRRKEHASFQRVSSVGLSPLINTAINLWKNKRRSPGWLQIERLSSGLRGGLVKDVRDRSRRSEVDNGEKEPALPRCRKEEMAVMAAGQIRASESNLERAHVPVRVWSHWSVMFERAQPPAGSSSQSHIRIV